MMILIQIYQSEDVEENYSARDKSPNSDEFLSQGGRTCRSTRGWSSSRWRRQHRICCSRRSNDAELQTVANSSGPVMTRVCLGAPFSDSLRLSTYLWTFPKRSALNLGMRSTSSKAIAVRTGPENTTACCIKYKNVLGSNPQNDEIFLFDCSQRRARMPNRGDKIAVVERPH